MTVRTNEQRQRQFAGPQAGRTVTVRFLSLQQSPRTTDVARRQSPRDEREEAAISVTGGAASEVLF
jgi:hypothetical protein